MSEEQGSYALTTTREANALVEVEQQRAIAETQAAMIIAKRFPRDVTKAIDRIQNACTRPGLAEAALYQYAKGGTDITGPSIRLAEAIAQNWGNLQFGIRELDQRTGSSTVEAFAWDIETNTRQVKIFQVAHKRYTKKGSYALDDPRDIYEMVANQGARRLRACILGVIPGDVVESAVTQCEATLKTKAAVTPERIAGTLEKFAEYNVNKEQIEARIQRRLEAMTPAQMVNLAKIYNSLKDGMSVPADWFEMPKVEPTLPKAEINGEGKPGAKVYDFKSSEKEPAPETKAPEVETKEPASETKEPEPEKKPEAPKPDLAKEQIAVVLAEIKGARPKASEQAKEAFKGLYLGNRDLILSLTGSDFEYAKGKFINAGLSWENDLIGANQAQAATSPETPANGSKEGEKAQSPGLVDFGDGGNEGEPKEEWHVKALEYRQAFTDLGPQGEKAWVGIIQLYSMTGKDLGTMAPGYRDAFLKRCQGQLDMEIAKKDGGK